MLSIKDFQKMMTIIVAAYPNSKVNTTNQVQMSIWYDSLKDLEATKLALAVKSIIATHEFVPTIATIRTHYAEVDMPVKVDAEEGWGLVNKAIRYYGYMRADEAMASLPAQVQRAVQYCGGFMSICEAEKVDVIRGQFNKAMASAINSTKQEKSLGNELTDQIKLFNLQSEEKDKLKIEVKEESKYDITERKQDERNLQSMKNVRGILNSMGACTNEK